MVKKRSKCFFCNRTTTNMKKHIKNKCNDFVQLPNDVFSTKIMSQIRYDQLVILLNKKMKSFTNLFSCFYWNLMKHDINGSFYLDSDHHVLSMLYEKGVRNLTVQKNILNKCDNIYPVYKRVRNKSFVCITENTWAYYEFSYLKHGSEFYKYTKVFHKIKTMEGKEICFEKYLSMFDKMEQFWEINNILLRLENIEEKMSK